MGLTSTRKNERATYSFGAPLEQELLNFGMEEVVGYITSTGSSWAGNVESAKFTVITEPFERYLDVRGVGEEPLGEDAQQDDNAAQLRKAFPVRHPWWFRTISPDGWKAVDHGIQRTYKDYKPQDPIVLCYYMTELPRLPEEVPAFLDQFLANLPDNSAALSGRTQLNKAVKPDEDRNPAGQAAVELRRLKELLLATYGKAPQDQLVRQHVTTQIWYSPREGFTMEALSKTQKAILDQIDGRIAEAREAQPLPKN
jgi:hypothetical protein